VIARYALLLGSLLLLSGCAMWPYKQRYVIATRPESVTDTNIVEQFIQSDTGIASWELLKPCYAGPNVGKDPIHRSFFVRDRAGKRTDLAQFDFLNEWDHPDWTGRRNLYYGDGWKIRPVIGTNLWLAMYARSAGKKFRHAKLYLFEPKRIVLQRELVALGDSPDAFAFDAANRRITYRTESGSQTLDLVEDVIMR
jgi:hypothetical protein